MTIITKLIRPEIESITPYKISNDEGVRLDRNENPWQGYCLHEELQLNRYPGDSAEELLAIIANHYQLKQQQILLSRGSSEAIDLIIRTFCRPYQDAILIFPPTFNMYQIYGQINAIEIQGIAVNRDDFSLDIERIISTIQQNVKIIFICSPNNPTGNVIPIAVIAFLCEKFSRNRIVVVDEAYIDFSEQKTSLALLNQFENLIILRSLSKGFGVAGIRCGITFASAEIIFCLKKIIAPYAINSISLYVTKNIFDQDVQAIIQKRIQIIKKERKKLQNELSLENKIISIWPSEANFILISVPSAKKIFNHCKQHQFLLRDVSEQLFLENCVRITVGSPVENSKLLDVIRGFK